MTALTPQSFEKELKSGKLKRVYFFYGDEYFLIERALNHAIEKIIPENVRDFNLDLLYGEDVSGDRIIQIATAIPMMAQKRLVIVKNIDRLSAEGKTLLLKYAARPASQTTLILVSNHSDLKKFHKDLLKHAVGVQFKSLTERRLFQWIQEEVQNRGKRITPRATQLLLARSGRSLQEISNEIDKLLQFTKEKSEIDETAVEGLVGVSKAFNIFEVWDSIGEKKFMRTVAIVRQMLELGESPIYIVTMLTSYFTKLLRIKMLQAKGLPAKEIAAKTHTPPYFIEKYFRQAKNYSEAKIVANFRYLLAADQNLKSHYQNQRLIMDFLLYHLTHERTIRTQQR